MVRCTPDLSPALAFSSASCFAFYQPQRKPAGLLQGDSVGLKAASPRPMSGALFQLQGVFQHHSPCVLGVTGSVPRQASICVQSIFRMFCIWEAHEECLLCAACEPCACCSSWPLLSAAKRHFGGPNSSLWGMGAAIELPSSQPTALVSHGASLRGGGAWKWH